MSEILTGASARDAGHWPQILNLHHQEETMSEGHLEKIDFDRWLSLSEATAHAAAIVSNNAFSAAMMKAAARGREKIRPGVFVDTSAPIAVRIMRATMPISACGSPAALCVEIGASPGGAGTLR